LSRKGDEGPSFEILSQDQLWNCPQKANGRPGFHESAILLLRQGMVAGTTFAAIPCPVLTAMPRHISDKTLENNSQRSRERM
jgi:hypothetical protein